MAGTHGKYGNVYKWNGTAANLSAEACTESGAQAQITDTAKRLLNPNCTDLVFTDSGGANVIKIDYVNGIAYFDANVATVTVTGTNAYIASANLIQTGYIYGWSLDFALELGEITPFQDDWKTRIAGLAEVSGKAEGYFAGINWYDDVEDVIDQTMDYFVLELFSYDPDDDGTGDHITAWVIFDSFNLNAPIGEVVKEAIGFKIEGIPVFTANA